MNHPARIPCFLLLALAASGLHAQQDPLKSAACGEALAAFSALFGLASGVPALIRRACTELAVTDRRVIYKSGLLARHTLEMNRSKVESVDVDQSLLGRLLGFGTITVRGTGGSLEPIRLISDPLTFRSHITAG